MRDDPPEINAVHALHPRAKIRHKNQTGSVRTIELKAAKFYNGLSNNLCDKISKQGFGSGSVRYPHFEDPGSRSRSESTYRSRSKGLFFTFFTLKIYKFFGKKSSPESGSGANVSNPESGFANISNPGLGSP